MGRPATGRPATGHTVLPGAGVPARLAAVADQQAAGDGFGPGRYRCGPAHRHLGAHQSPAEASGPTDPTGP